MRREYVHVDTLNCDFRLNFKLTCANKKCNLCFHLYKSVDSGHA